MSDKTDAYERGFEAALLAVDDMLMRYADEAKVDKRYQASNYLNAARRKLDLIRQGSGYA